jgi:predicted enzyme related to lactoylglutathione lyase
MYYVEDLEKSAEFYKKLGLIKAWEDKKRKMIGFEMKDTKTEIVIHSDPDLPSFDYSFLVDDVLQFCDDFVAMGFQVKSDPFKVRCGWYAILLDPDGNELNIIDLSAMD